MVKVGTSEKSRMVDNTYVNGLLRGVISFTSSMGTGTKHSELLLKVLIEER